MKNEKSCLPEQSQRSDEHPVENQATEPSHERVARIRGPIRILRLRQVMDITGLTRFMLYQLQDEGDFPMRVKLTERSVGWVEEEIQAWLARRLEESPAASAAKEGSPSSCWSAA